MHSKLQFAIESEEQLEEMLSRPSPLVLDTLRTLDSDLVILGAGGKMGPTLARMAVRARDELRLPYRVIAVARYSRPELRARLESWGVETIACDLVERDAVMALPDSRNVIYMAGQKFGSTANPHLTWAINTYAPMLAAERYTQARMVVFSTGNVYPFMPVTSGGATEEDAVAPVGEYASSCVGRERIFEYFSLTHGLRCAIVRLNYAIEVRYGVLVDIARRVWQEEPVALATGMFNAIWQGDANAQALALLAHCSSPPFVLNVTGPEMISVRWAAQEFGRLLGKAPVFEGTESAEALISNAAKAQQLLGYPSVSLRQMMIWIAEWIRSGGTSLNKPTHFEVRDGKF